MTGAHWLILAAATAAAVLCLWWTRRRPRIRGVDAEGRFERVWARPKLTPYKAGDRRVVRVVLNRYPGIVIGVALQVGQRVLGLTWARPRWVRHPRVDEQGRREQR